MLMHIYLEVFLWVGIKLDLIILWYHTVNEMVLYLWMI